MFSQAVDRQIDLRCRTANSSNSRWRIKSTTTSRWIQAICKTVENLSKLNVEHVWESELQDLITDQIENCKNLSECIKTAIKNETVYV